MTAQEQQMLQGLADRVNGTQLAEKDNDAEQMIQQTLGRNPDALYVMAQTVLVQQYALEQAQKQMADLRTQLSQAQQRAAEPRHTSSFLGGLLGHHDEPARPASAPPPPPAPAAPFAAPAPQAAPAQPGYQPAYPQAYGAGPGFGYPVTAAPQGGGFLRSAMQTATGVAAGALAFEGIEGLMHGFGHAAGYGTEFVAPMGTGLGGGGFGGEPREEIVNNYYGDANPGGGDAGNRRDDVSDRGDLAQFGSGNDAGEGLHDASYGTDGTGQSLDGGANADDGSGNGGWDDSAQGDDSTLSDDASDQGSDAGFDSGGDFGGDDSGSFGGDDSGSF